MQFRATTYTVTHSHSTVDFSSVNQLILVPTPLTYIYYNLILTKYGLYGIRGDGVSLYIILSAHYLTFNIRGI